MTDSRDFQRLLPSEDTSMPERLDEGARQKGIIRGVPLFHFITKTTTLIKQQNNPNN